MNDNTAKKMASRIGAVRRASLSAHVDMDRMKINPIEMLKEVFDESMKAYRSGRGYGESGDAGPYYLSVAEKAATCLARFKHPTMAPITVQDLYKDNKEASILTTEQAVSALKADPFAPKEVKEISTERVINAMESQIKEPFLPAGIIDKLDQDE
jgi:hypothetical protein